MKYLTQFSIIMIFVVLGELCERLIPLPIAGSIYGLVLLFLTLCVGVIKLRWVEDIATSMHGIMSLFFIAPAAAVIDIWPDIANVWWMLVLLLVAAYLVTMLITGITADMLIKNKKGKSK